MVTNRRSRQTRSARIQSLSVCFPRTVRTNDFWRKNYPEVVASAEERALGKVWTVRGDPQRELTAFESEMIPFLKDPFRGTVERRVLAPGESVLSIEAPAARSAIAAAGLIPADVDLLVCCAFPSEDIVVGQSAYVARELGLRGAAWNVESACSSATVGLDIAASMVEVGRYERVLVLASCVYSRVTDPADTLCFTVGDGAAAFVVTAGGRGAEVLGSHNLHTAETCDAITTELVLEGGLPVRRMKTMRGAADSLREVAERTVVECCTGAAAAAGVAISDIDLFACNTPTAWFAPFVARRLGVDRARVVDTHPLYANVGPVLWPAALHHAASAGRLAPDALVMLYSVGSVASAGAAVLRWGDVALGPAPAPPEIRL